MNITGTVHTAKETMKLILSTYIEVKSGLCLSPLYGSLESGGRTIFS